MPDPTTRKKMKKMKHLLNTLFMYFFFFFFDGSLHFFSLNLVFVVVTGEKLRGNNQIFIQAVIYLLACQKKKFFFFFWQTTNMADTPTHTHTHIHVFCQLNTLVSNRFGCFPVFIYLFIQSRFFIDLWFDTLRYVRYIRCDSIRIFIFFCQGLISCLYIGLYIIINIFWQQKKKNK